MTPRDWFVLGIRMFGLWLVTRGVSYAATLADFKLGLNEARGVNPTGYLLYGAFDFALAAYFLLGARHIALCDGEDRRDKEADDLA